MVVLCWSFNLYQTLLVCVDLEDHAGKTFNVVLRFFPLSMFVGCNERAEVPEMTMFASHFDLVVVRIYFVF